MELAAHPRAEIFPYDAQHDKRDPQQSHRRQHGQIQTRTNQRKEQNVDNRSGLLDRELDIAPVLWAAVHYHDPHDHGGQDQ